MAGLGSDQPDVARAAGVRQRLFLVLQMFMYNLNRCGWSRWASSAVTRIVRLGWLGGTAATMDKDGLADRHRVIEGHVEFAMFG